MDEKLLARAEKVLKLLQEKQARDYSLLCEAAKIQTQIEEALEKTKTCEKVRVDWVMFKSAKTGRINSMPFLQAKNLQEKGKGEIVREFKPEYEKHWKTEKEPPLLNDLRHVHLGDPVTIRGQHSEFFKAINRAIGLECPLITAAAYQINLIEEEDDDKKAEKA